MYIDLRTNEKQEIWKRRVPPLVALAMVIILAGAAAWFLVGKASRVKNEMSTEIVQFRPQSKPAPTPKPPAWRYIPGPISMDLVKSKGCVADGFLSEYGGKTKQMVKLINRSECTYLHRALETWLDQPDFEKASEIMQKVEKRPMVYGMFLAEAISAKGEYDDPLTGKDYGFSQMCREGSENRWGDHTCIPSVQKPEYRRYLRSITRQAMNLGIQGFLFGQIMLQDERPGGNTADIEKVLGEMRRYANELGIDIIIGAQTNSITDERYLRLFDYIEGGIGIDSQGQIENGPCLSGKGGCWALLWHDNFRLRANDVILHLDWSGLPWDDMGIFARMDRNTRAKTLSNLHQFFSSRKMGFLMPFLAVLNKENNGCYGPDKHFYSPDHNYRCKDEEAINKILRGTYR
ncbi:MAG: hypothetical protein NT136_02385 [Candidatus Moranbacteria bacterium]|nr:hypothetical protein [Candidatus Moranbacteria bacterium]